MTDKPHLDAMCTQFEVFEAPWHEDAKWGFRHDDHWVFYRTEDQARQAAAVLSRAHHNPDHRKFEITGLAKYEAGFTLTVEAESPDVAITIARSLVAANDPSVGHAQLDMTEVNIEDVTETA